MLFFFHHRELIWHLRMKVVAANTLFDVQCFCSSSSQMWNLPMSSSWQVGSQYWFHPQFSYTDAPITQAALHAFQPSFHPQISCVNSIFSAKSAVFPGKKSRIHMANTRHFPVVPVARLERRHAAGGAGAHPPGPGGAARGCRHLERAAADGAAGSAGGTAESHRDGTGGRKGDGEIFGEDWRWVLAGISISISILMMIFKIYIILYRWNRWTWEGYGASDDVMMMVGWWYSPSPHVL